MNKRKPEYPICEFSEMSKTLAYGCPNCKEIIETGCDDHCKDVPMLEEKYKKCSCCGQKLKWHNC